MNIWIKKIIERYDKCVAWGAGNYYQMFHMIFDESISYIIDQSEEKQGKVLNGHYIYPPSNLTEEDPEKSLIIVFNAEFDQLCSEVEKYGAFDVIDASMVAVMYNEENDEEILLETYNDIPNCVMVICGIRAFFAMNGSRKFIESQNDIIHKNGFKTLEVIPLDNYMKKGREINYSMVSINRKCLGVFTIEELTERYYDLQAVIIHSLYYQHEFLEKILSSVSVKNHILYYLHDYYCICNNRFLFFKDKKCLNEHNRLICNSCPNNDMHIRIMEFHNKLFYKYHIVLVAPSNDTAGRVKEYLHYNNITVIPHLMYKEKDIYIKLKKKRRIAYLGGATFMKGWDGYSNLFDSLNDKYDFYCMGFCKSEQKKKGITYIEVSLNSDKNNKTMVEVLNGFDIDIAYIGSIWPETYSYTYYEAYEAGCFVITTLDSGNVCDQVNKNKNGLTFGSIEDMRLWLEDTERVERDMMDKVHKCIYEVRSDENFMTYLFQ